MKKKPKINETASWSPFNVFKNFEHDVTEAVIYVRVSSKAQLKRGDGLASQERLLREYAKFKGYTVVAVFSDDLTGESKGRPGMQAMLSYIEQPTGGSRTVVLFDGVSRMARGIRTHEEIRDAIFAAGGIPEGPSVSFGRDADGRMVEYVMATAAQHQREKNAEQTVSRMRARLLGGYWVFAKPIGYEYKLVSGSGKILVRKEPVASIIQEALEGYASGYFDSQAEVKRFLETQPLFLDELPKGKITNQGVNDILTRVVYSGYVEHGPWDVCLREGKHEGLISLATFEKIQDRLTGRKKAPARTDLNDDFPLRGFILCGDCNKPLTACWSKSKTGKRHPYYLCYNQSCEGHRKSIRRDDVEGAFEQMVKRLEPSTQLVGVARAMFKKAWDIRLAQSHSNKAELQSQVGKIEKQIEQIVDRIVDTESETTISAYERRIEKLEKDKLLLRETAKIHVGPKHSFEDMFELALGFLASPWKLWTSPRLEDKRTVLKLAFTERLAYCRKKGLRTPKMALPFKVLGDFDVLKMEMARSGRFELPTP